VITGKVPLHTLLPKGAEAAPASKVDAAGAKKPAVEHPFPAAAASFGSPPEMLYLQQTLYAGLGPRVVADFNAYVAAASFWCVVIMAAVVSDV
jgi:hypothetical protein